MKDDDMLPDEYENSEMSLESINEFLEKVRQKANDENSELLKEVEEFVAKFDELIAKSDDLEAEIQKKKEERKSGKQFSEYLEKNIKNMTNAEIEQAKQKMYEIVRCGEEYLALIREQNAVLTEILSMKPKLEELINKFNL